MKRSGRAGATRAYEKSVVGTLLDKPVRLSRVEVALKNQIV